MKKLLLSILILFMMCSLAFSAGSSSAVLSDTGELKNQTTGEMHRIVTIEAVADDTDGSIPDLLLHDRTTNINAYYPLKGWKLFQVVIDGDHAGAHDGSANASVLNDTDAGYGPGDLVGLTLTNSTDSSSGTVTANTSSTVTATLAGGTDNDWDVSDTSSLGTEPQEDSELYIYQHGADLLGAAGVNMVDNSTENIIQPKINSVVASPPIVDDLCVTITQQAAAVNDAIVFVKLILKK